MEGSGDPPDPPDETVGDKMDLTLSENASHGKCNSNGPLEASRVRIYPESANGPYTVFFRKIDRPLNLLLISAELNQKFKTVKEIKQVELRKIRVTMSDRNEANEVVVLPRFKGLYRVYIPSAEVEIDGVVYDEVISPEEVVKIGQGKFTNPQLPMISVLECERLAMREEVASNEMSFKPSNAMRVTFAGTALPDYLCINGALLKVRLYSPKIMLCRKCGRLGHTSKYCSLKPRCGQCGGNHDVAACEEASTSIQKCLLCMEPHGSMKNCRNYQAKKRENKQLLLNRSRLSYETLVKQVDPTFVSENTYQALTHHEDEDNDGTNSSNSGFKPPRRKRKRDVNGKSVDRISSPKDDTTSKKNKPKNKINDRNDQKLPHSTRDPFPPLPSGRDVPGFRKIQEQKAEQTQSFSGQNVTELVKTICKFLNFDQFWIDMIVKVIPLLTALWNKLTSLSTPLETPQPL
uniref:CCHC-type domain-containing protein n=1 Tax=Aedes aegypti TaxID=7159 RepID=A0A0N8ES57_AEDAE